MENMVINNIALTKHNDKYTFKVYFKPETIDASYVSFFRSMDTDYTGIFYTALSMKKNGAINKYILLSEPQWLFYVSSNDCVFYLPALFTNNDIYLECIKFVKEYEENKNKLHSKVNSAKKNIENTKLPQEDNTSDSIIHIEFIKDNNAGNYLRCFLNENFIPEVLKIKLKTIDNNYTGVFFTDIFISDIFLDATNKVYYKSSVCDVECTNAFSSQELKMIQKECIKKLDTTEVDIRNLITEAYKSKDVNGLSEKENNNSRGIVSKNCNYNLDSEAAVDKAKELTLSTPNGVIRDADTILEDYLNNRETEISGIAEEVFGIYKNTTDKESVKAMFEALVGTSFDNYVEECIKNTTKNIDNN